MAAAKITGPGSGNSNGNGLLLYHHYASYYSQKVVMALREKRLKYKVHIVQLLRFEQYQPWFMCLNPKGQVPVLKDGVKIIPDSARIIDYLEDNFSNGDTPRLWPERGTEQAAKVQQFRDVLYSLPIETITFGCIKYPELTQGIKIPRAIQKLMLESGAKKTEVLNSLASKYPEFAEHYTHRQNRSWQRDDIQNIEGVKLALLSLEKVLDDIEEELEQNIGERSEWWLCSDKFTVADISLAVLLHRLSILGLASKFWGEGRRSHLAAYFRRSQNRESCKVALYQMPRIITVWAALHDKAPTIVSVVLAAIVVGAVFYRYRS